MLIKISWRNIWRKKWRSIITLGMIAFSVFLAVMMRSIQTGSYENMVANVVGFYSGYAQIHANGYQDEKSLENSMAFDPALLQLASENKAVEAVVPRLEGFALSSSGPQTRGAMVVGVDPEAENKLTGFVDRLQDGQTFGADDKSVVIGAGLAEFYGIGANDTLILLGQGYHGVSAAGKYPVAGVAKFSSPQLNDNLVMLPLKEAQWFFGAEERLTSIALMVDNSRETAQVVADLRGAVDTTQYEVMTWEEMMPELVQMIQADSAGGVIMVLILYVVIAFGIFGTVVMMTAERKYEFGVLVSIGMRRWKIGVTVLLETLFLGVLGAGTGILLSLPIVHYFNANPIKLTGQAAQSIEKFGFEPIVPASTDPGIALTHALIILVITMLISIYPWINISKLNPVKAMRA